MTPGPGWIPRMPRRTCGCGPTSWPRVSGRVTGGVYPVRMCRRTVTQASTCLFPRGAPGCRPVPRRGPSHPMPSAVCRAASVVSRSTTSMSTATRVGFCGSVKVRMLVTPSGPKNSSRFGEASQWLVLDVVVGDHGGHGVSLVVFVAQGRLTADVVFREVPDRGARSQPARAQLGVIPGSDDRG